MWKTVADLCVAPDEPLSEVLGVIDQGGISLALVTGSAGELFGTITDGDVRRALLRGTPLSVPAEYVMNREPVTAPIGIGRDALLVLMRGRRVKQIPVLSRGRVVDVAVLERLLEGHGLTESLRTPVILMCGGLGTRLRPLTDTLPKPLLPVRGRPLLEHTIEHLVAEGFRRLYLAVHYKAEAFEALGIRGERWGIELEYVHEPNPSGTAGALARLRDVLTEPFLVVNGDVLTEMSFRRLLDFHLEHEHLVTLSVTPYEVRIPYGVVSVEGDRVRSLVEKPLHSFLTNAGIYAMDPQVLARLPAREYVDMDEVIAAALEASDRVGAYPVHEYWIDIGRPAAYEEAQLEVPRPAAGGDRA